MGRDRAFIAATERDCLALISFTRAVLRHRLGQQTVMTRGSDGPSEQTRRLFRRADLPGGGNVEEGERVQGAGVTGLGQAFAPHRSLL